MRHTAAMGDGRGMQFSKIQSGMLQLDIRPFALHDCIDGTLEIVQMKAEAKGLELVSFVSSDVPRITVGDPGRLRQILLNLLSNAIKVLPCLLSFSYVMGGIVS